MKVTFIQPPIEDFYTTPIRRQPLGLLYLAAVARSIGWQVTFIDGHSPKKKIIPIPSQFDYLQKHMHSDSKKYRFPFKHYYHFGTSYQELKKRISNTPSDIFAVSSLFTPYHQESEKIISLIKECHPNTPIVTGGGHASIHPSSMLEAGANFVIQGEGEKSFIELLKKIDLKNETQLPTNIIAPQAPTQLDEIPIPARDLLADRSLKMFKKKALQYYSQEAAPMDVRFA